MGRIRREAKMCNIYYFRNTKPFHPFSLQFWAYSAEYSARRVLLRIP